MGVLSAITIYFEYKIIIPTDREKKEFLNQD